MLDELNLEGICRGCDAPTPISRNTQTENGIVCGMCRIGVVQCGRTHPEVASDKCRLPLGHDGLHSANVEWGAA